MGHDMAKRNAHSLIAKMLHWGFVALFIYAIFKGLDGVEQLEDRALLIFEIKFASVFLAVLLARFFFMKYFSNSALPENAPQWQHKAARLGHYALYLSIGAIALSGLIIGLLYLVGVKSGFVMAAFLFLHEASITASYAVIAIHIGAALYHRLLKDGVWSSMVPFWKES